MLSLISCGTKLVTIAIIMTMGQQPLTRTLSYLSALSLSLSQTGKHAHTHARTQTHLAATNKIRYCRESPKKEGPETNRTKKSFQEINLNRKKPVLFHF